MRAWGDLTSMAWAYYMSSCLFLTQPISPFLQPMDITVTVEPVFVDCCKPQPDAKIGLNVRVGLTCEAPWVVTPTHLVIMNVARV